MEAEDVDHHPKWRVPQPGDDEESGSAYEAPSSEEEGTSPDGGVSPPVPFEANSQKGRGRSNSRNRKNQSYVARVLSTNSEGRSTSRAVRNSSPYNLERIRQDAIQWAANFREPETPEDIVSLPRHATRMQPKKRRIEKSPSEVRAKRLKEFYNNDYRELLNDDIYDVASKVVHDDQKYFQGSQIGSLTWTSKEKAVFFPALSRLGKDDVRGIAGQIGTKSEVEVQEYVRLLHQEMMEKRLHDPGKLLDIKDLPAAFEISQECCSLLERAGDAIGSLQERSEEEVEQTKWGDAWLLTGDLSLWLDEQRKVEGEQGIGEALPATSLLNLKNWLELSHRIFMNPAAPREEDNWRTLSQPGETPAIRATAFEDFYSLAVSTTKRIMSTTLFCAMSRERARNSQKAKKYLDVYTDDVEAAVKILGLKSNSKDSWIGCAKRCNLSVFDDKGDSKAQEGITMTYDEVERALRGVATSYRSRSRSASQNLALGISNSGTGDEAAAATSPLSLNLESDDGWIRAYNGYSSSEGSDDQDGLDISDNQSTSTDSPQPRVAQRIRARKWEERAQEKSIETFDTKASHMEEERLWALLGQPSPFDTKAELLDASKRPQNATDAVEDIGDWRSQLEYWSRWETHSTLVPKEKFARNKSKSRRARRELSRGRAERHLAPRPERMDNRERLLSGDSEGDGAEEYASAEDDHGQSEGDEARSEHSDAGRPSASPQSVYSGGVRHFPMYSSQDGGSDDDPTIKSEIN